MMEEEYDLGIEIGLWTEYDEEGNYKASELKNKNYEKSKNNVSGVIYRNSA